MMLKSILKSRKVKDMEVEERSGLTSEPSESLPPRGHRIYYLYYVQAKSEYQDGRCEEGIVEDHCWLPSRSLTREHEHPP